MTKKAAGSGKKGTRKSNVVTNCTQKRGGKQIGKDERKGFCRL